MSKYVPLAERVAALTAEGLKPAEIGPRIGLSERGVRVHLARAAGKISAKELVAATGATYRQVNYWTAKGYLTPLDLGPVKGSRLRSSGSGSEDMFDPETVHIVVLVVELIECGFEVVTAFDIARTMEASGVLAHTGTGEPATAMVGLPHGWKLVRSLA